jgi:hypothetical protein
MTSRGDRLRLETESSSMHDVPPCDLRRRNQILLGNPRGDRATPQRHRPAALSDLPEISPRTHARAQECHTSVGLLLPITLITPRRKLLFLCPPGATPPLGQRDRDIESLTDGPFSGLQLAQGSIHGCVVAADSTGTLRSSSFPFLLGG